MNYLDELRERLIEAGTLTPVLASGAVGAGISTFFGVKSLVGVSGIEAGLIAFASAAVVSAGLFFVWHTLVKVIPMLESPIKRALGVGLATCLTVVTVLISSWFIATSIGGSRAVQAYMNNSVAAAYTEVGNAVRNFADEQSLVAVISRNAAAWRVQAKNEEKSGTLSGRNGVGPIVATLNGAAADLEGLVAAMQRTRQDFQLLQEQAEGLLADLTRIANSAEADTAASQQKFSEAYGQFFERLRVMERLSLLQQAKLGGVLVISTTTGGSISEDLNRIQVTLDKQTRELQGAIRKIESSRREVKALPYMPTNKGMATWDFAASVPGAWLVGIGIDLLPFLVLLLLMLGHSEARKPHRERTPFSIIDGGRDVRGIS